ncbi:MAG TPA: hypothetical protein DCP92_01535 [Nitrospiraceae bacterium]|jgi:CRISPR type IV-associated protein Csf3|nr:hypothetical protein [Nitrospiraceae bacterium]
MGLTTVSVEMAGPLVVEAFARFTPFDSLIAYAAVERYRARHEDCKIEDIRKVVDDLPFRKIPINKGTDYLYASSVAKFSEEIPLQGKYYDGFRRIYKANTVAKMQEYWSKDLILEGVKECLNQARGRFKPSIVSLPVMLVPEIKWVFDGDGEAVEDLFSDITHLGKKTAIGYGRIKGFDFSDAEGVPIERPLPKQEYDVKPPFVFLRLKPAYWLKTGRYLAGMGTL